MGHEIFVREKENPDVELIYVQCWVACFHSIVKLPYFDAERPTVPICEAAADEFHIYRYTSSWRIMA